MTSEKQFRKELWEHYKRNSERTKREKERGEVIIGGVYTDNEIKKMMNIDIKTWKEAIKKRSWGFRLCTGARCFLK